MRRMSAVGIGVLCVAQVSLLSACAAHSKDPSPVASTSRDLITESELAEVDAINAYTAVQQLRPQWLRSRGAASFRDSEGTSARVCVDNMPLGDLASLQNIPIFGITEIRYISGPDATTRWGTGVVGGVIEVIRIKG